VTSLFDRIGGRPALVVVVDDFYDRLATDPRVLHHFPDEVLPRLRLAQVEWLTGALGGAPGQPMADLAEAHRDVEITDEQVAVVVAHLDAAVAAAGVHAELRRQVMSVVSRLWYARVF
jgi:hemoglobin